MDPPPALPRVEWPRATPNALATVVPNETSRQLFVVLATLRQYIETQYTRCGVSHGAP